MRSDEIENRFTHHPPSNQTVVNMHEAMREGFKDIAHALNDGLIDGREKSLALTHLEEAMFWANASVARTMNHD